MKSVINMNKNDIIKKRYNRVAKYYDLMEGLMESSGWKTWRKKFWSLVKGDTILEAGVGTGNNIEMYPDGKKIFAIDFASKMVEIV